MNEKGKNGEEAVNQITSGTYLKYWCYPDPKDEKGNKKEICDLLILFKDTVIIIEVKNYEFKGDYERYFRNTLEKAISQISGAERKLFQSDRNLFFNHPLKGEKEFIKTEFKIVQRIIVNLSTVPLFYPGGTLTSNDKFIHIFNWFAFLKVIQELDTIPDLIQYLNEREKTFFNKQIVILAGEKEEWTPDIQHEFTKYSQKLNPLEKPYILISGNELDLLADYFFNERKFNSNFYSNEFNGAYFELDNNWNKYINKEQVRLKKEEDKVSYFLDQLIIKEILYYDTDDRIDMATELLALSRFERRVVGSNFYSFIEKHKNIDNKKTVRRYGTLGDLTIGYFIHSDKIELDQVMKMMTIAAQGYSYWEAYKSKKILIIGINASLTQVKFFYDDNIKEILGQKKEDLIHDLNVLKWFTKIERIENNFQEYPET